MPHPCRLGISVESGYVAAGSGLCHFHKEFIREYQKDSYDGVQPALKQFSGKRSDSLMKLDSPCSLHDIILWIVLPFDSLCLHYNMIQELPIR